MGCCSTSSSDQIFYSGPTLSCIGLETNESLTIALQKINEAVCNSGGGGSQDLQSVLDLGNNAESNIILTSETQNIEINPTQLTIELNGGEGEYRTKLGNNYSQYYTTEDKMVYLDFQRSAEGTASYQFNPDNVAGSYTIATESAISGTFANPTSITVENGIITAIS